MAATNGRTKGDLIDALLHEAWNFDFYRAVRLLERTGSESSWLGRDNLPDDEIVRIRPEASFRFAPSAIAQFTSANNAAGSKNSRCMTITFFGLYGRYGTLPWHYTSRIIHVEQPSQADKRYPDNGLRPFLDIFNHRLISLFYRAGIKYRWPLVYRQKNPANRDDRGDGTTRNFIAFTGLGTRHLIDRDFPFPEYLFLRYAGLFITPRSAASLAALLSDILGVRVNIHQFQGEWLEVEEDDYCRIGHAKGNNRLGSSFTIGRRIYSRQHRFRVVIGPIDFDYYQRLLPDRELFNKVCTLVRLHASVAMEFDCQMIVERRNIQGIALGKRLACLGRTFFLVAPNGEHPVASPVFSADR